MLKIQQIGVLGFHARLLQKRLGAGLGEAGHADDAFVDAGFGRRAGRAPGQAGPHFAAHAQNQEVAGQLAQGGHVMRRGPGKLVFEFLD